MDKIERIKFYIGELKRFYRECSENGERALGAYALCLLRFLNGYSQVAYSQYHIYEMAVTWEAVELFAKYFLEQSELALKKENAEEKKAIITDIEVSLTDISMVFRNVTDSASNADRHDYHSLTPDTNMYEISPKLCVLYVNILQEFCRLFDGDNSRYAFILHPSIGSNMLTEVLFKKREKTGKIILIHVAERMDGNMGIIPVYLIHEAFHVITKKERCRKQRAFLFMQQMLLVVEQHIFNGIELSGDPDTEREWRKRIMAKGFDSLHSMMDELAEYSADSRDFYGSKIKNLLVKNLRMCLLQLYDRITVILADILLENAGGMDYNGFNKRYEKLKELTKCLQDNVIRAALGGNLDGAASLILTIYHEAYADMATVLTLEITPEVYDRAFEYSMPFERSDGRYYDTNCQFRKILVAKAVSSYAPAHLAARWTGAADVYLNDSSVFTKAHREDVLEAGMLRRTDMVINSIKMTDAIERHFMEYLRDCAVELLGVMDGLGGDLKEFREGIRRVMSQDGSILPDIMFGDAKEIFTTDDKERMYNEKNGE